MKDNNGVDIRVGDEVVYVHRMGIYAYESELLTGKVAAVSSKSIAIEINGNLYTTDSCFIIRKGVV